VRSGTINRGLLPEEYSHDVDQNRAPISSLRKSLQILLLFFLGGHVFFTVRPDALEILPNHLAMAEGDLFAVENRVGHFLVLLILFLVLTAGLLLALRGTGHFGFSGAIVLSVGGELFFLAFALQAGSFAAVVAGSGLAPGT